MVTENLWSNYFPLKNNTKTYLGEKTKKGGEGRRGEGLTTA